jgi:hypothetical protein
VLVVAWSVDAPASRRAFEALAREGGELVRTGLRVVPISTDSGRDLARARRALEDTPWAADAGFADGRAIQDFEFTLLEVLGFFHAVPFPTSFLFDPGGHLVAVYVGELDPAVVNADLQSLRRSPPDQDLTTALTGGRWIRVPRRDLADLARIFEYAGNPDMARYLEGLRPR